MKRKNTNQVDRGFCIILILLGAALTINEDILDRGLAFRLIADVAGLAIVGLCCWYLSSTYQNKETC